MPHGWRVCAEKQNPDYAFFRVFSCCVIKILPMLANPAFCQTILRRRFARKSFKNAIELRQRLKSDGECDFADTAIRISQEITRVLEPSMREILDKVYAGHVLKLFAQMIRTKADHFRHLPQRKFFGRMLLYKPARLPDLNRFGSMPRSDALKFRYGQHL